MDTTTIHYILNKEDFLPYDGTSTSTKYRDVLNSYPSLRTVLEKQLNSNTVWVDKARNNRVYYILVDDRWKHNQTKVNPILELKLIGLRNDPVIEITL